MTCSLTEQLFYRLVLNGRFSTSPDAVFWDAKTQVTGDSRNYIRVVWAASTSQWIVAGAGQTSTYWSATGNTFNATSVTFATNYFGSNGSDMNNSMNQTIPTSNRRSD
jgi:hypothetical protein